MTSAAPVDVWSNVAHVRSERDPLTYLSFKNVVKLRQQQLPRGSSVALHRMDRQIAFASYKQQQQQHPESDYKDKELEKYGISIRRREPSTGNTSPGNILEEIIWYKAVEIPEMQEKMPLQTVQKQLVNAEPPKDFLLALKQKYLKTASPALIAEVKKASPSRGVLQPDFDPVRIAKSYEQGGAACLSVLTDSKFFQGSFDNLSYIRAAGIKCPLLCKEFIVDEWQVYYARLKGADAILLIAAVLTDEEIVSLMTIASSLRMTSLIEVHNEREMDRILCINDVQLIGINNRNLETFEVDIFNTVELLKGSRGKKIHAMDITVVGESGLFTAQDIALVQNAGVKAVLVGESLVKKNDPAAAIAELYGKKIA